MIGNLLLFSALAILVYMVLMFVIATANTDNSIVDIGWGMGFVVVSGVCLYLTDTYSARQILMTVLVVVWALRLSGYIFIRHRGVGEDHRYKQWREEWKFPVLRAFFQVFMLQGFFMWVVALPVIMSHTAGGTELTWINYIGVAVWLVGFFFEAVGDYQKYQFKTTPGNKQKTIMSGLWKYTRHPNYFGEFAMWWGIWLVSVGSGLWYVSLISPVMLSFLLLRVSGVTMLEQKYKGNAAYDAYKERTNAFFPAPPKQA